MGSPTYTVAGQTMEFSYDTEWARENPTSKIMYGQGRHASEELKHFTPFYTHGPGLNFNNNKFGNQEASAVREWPDD